MSQDHEEKQESSKPAPRVTIKKNERADFERYLGKIGAIGLVEQETKDHIEICVLRIRPVAFGIFKMRQEGKF